MSGPGITRKKGSEMKRKKQGPARMKELGKKKVEVWLSEAQAAALAKLCDDMGQAKATLARRMINYMTRGGKAVCSPLRNFEYD
jgi:hypothetical protein